MRVQMSRWLRSETLAEATTVPHTADGPHLLDSQEGWMRTSFFHGRVRPHHVRIATPVCMADRPRQEKKRSLRESMRLARQLVLEF